MLVSTKMPRIVVGRAISDIKLEKPFKLIIGGGCGAGKSEFIRKTSRKEFFVFIGQNYI